MAGPQKLGMPDGIALVDAHALVPIICHVRQLRIERRAQAADEIGQRIFEVAVLPFAEAVPSHVDMTSEMTLVEVELRDLPTLCRRQ